MEKYSGTLKVMISDAEGNSMKRFIRVEPKAHYDPNYNGHQLLQYQDIVRVLLEGLYKIQKDLNS